jgi:hypothetical protein
MLSQLLPTLLALDPYLRFINGATIYLVLASSAILSSACISLWSSSANLLGENSTTPASDLELYTCITRHLAFLSTAKQNPTRCDLPLLNHVQTLLSAFLTCAQYGQLDTDINNDLEGLSQYRWVDSGTGLIPLSPESAIKAGSWNVDILQQSRLTGSDGLPSIEEILDRCDPLRRICRPGCFDLCITVV